MAKKAKIKTITIWACKYCASNGRGNKRRCPNCGRETLVVKSQVN